jgi:glutathione synthase/RimK-type ligase-like ATP-grasp enzyme
MILLCGIASETPLHLVCERLNELREPYVLFHQRDFARSSVWFEISDSGIRGELTTGLAKYRLEDFRSVYVRLMDDRALPELDGEPPDSPLRRQCRAFHDTLGRWMEIAPARVVNRAAPQASNFSKPYQAQLIQQQGFLVPETLVTSEPEAVREFHHRHGEIIYKSISSIRSIVHTLKENDYERLDRIRWCPTQFQAFVPGTNLRVHTIGNRVFPVAICSEATDYRYSARDTGVPAELHDAELSDELAERCCRLSAALGLDFAGIDLKITPDHDVYCFEVNPSPAFSYYELSTGQPISAALARYLAWRENEPELEEIEEKLCSMLTSS